MYQLSTWQAEVSDDLKVLPNKDSAYRYAEKLQLEGRNVEVYENGILQSKLRSRKQYSLDV